MENILKKWNSKWFLLFLFMFFSITTQAQWDEDTDGDGVLDWVEAFMDSTPDGEDSSWESNGDGSFDNVNDQNSNNESSTNSDGMEDIIDDQTADDYAPLNDVPPPGFEDSKYILDDICVTCDDNNTPDTPQGFPDDDDDDEPVDFPDELPNPSPDPSPDPDPEKTWYLDYDGDGYHIETYSSINSPGDKWSLSTKGSDCDDTRKQYTTVCCTKTCDSGYKLNIDTCECALLPPCWGTVKDFETSNSFNTNTILDKLNSTLGDFGISTDVMDSIKQMDIFDPKTIAAGSDFLKFADNLGTIGDVGQASMDLLKYMDEPSTQNLLRTVLDTAAIGLSPAASLALSTIDYFKDSDGNSKLDLLLKAASNAIDRSLDCNLGLGIRNSVF